MSRDREAAVSGNRSSLPEFLPKPLHDALAERPERLVRSEICPRGSPLELLFVAESYFSIPNFCGSKAFRNFLWQPHMKVLIDLLHAGEESVERIAPAP